MIYVIGSGPAGVAAAYALKQRRSNICIVDVGNRLETDRVVLRNSIARVDNREWTTGQIACLKTKQDPTAGGMPKKLVYGSDFPYREPEVAAPWVTDNANVMRSYAQGGLSSVWGACVLPYPENELGAWPQRARDLAPHYRAICEFMPMTARHDDLGAEFPLYKRNPGNPELSRQVRRLLNDLDRSRDKLVRKGIRYGAARVAYENTDGNCRRCGLCLHGCPYELIYSSAMTLSSLMAEGIQYRDGIFVNRIQETGDGCRLYVTNTATGKAEILHAERVFVGAGIWGTAELMLRSMDVFDTDLTIKHSDRFMLPVLRWKSTSNLEEEELNTLCQLFIELSDVGIDKDRVHLQLYSYNDMMRSHLEQKLGRCAGLLRMPMNQFLSRLLIIYGYISSEKSGSISLRLASGKRERLIIKGNAVGESRHIASMAALRILRSIFAFRAVPGWPTMDLPGGGNHSGGSFPMSDHPTGMQTDVWGRVNGWSRTHVVDSSVFSSLPAGTIAFPAMANAHRIASRCTL